MPVERDDESTTFDAKPWGSVQRLLPMAARFAVVRTSEPLPEAVVPEVKPLAKPVARKPARTPPAPTRSPNKKFPMVAIQLPIPAPAPGAFAMRMSTLAMPSPAPVIAKMPAPTMVMTMPLAMPMPSALPMPEFTAEIDSTMRVRRKPLTRRSLIAAPVGALFAAILIVMLSAGSRGGAKPAASVRMNTAQPALPVLDQQPVVPPSPVAAAAFVTPEVAAYEPTIDDANDADETEIADAAPSAKPSKRVAKRHKHRPRKIIAGDTSTPLGNLRPGRF